MSEQWLEWAQRIQSIAQAGLTFTEDTFDRERYEALRVIAAEITSSHSDAEFDPILKLLEGQDGYPTPKVGVRGAVFRDEAILMVKDRRLGIWTLPGGFVDINESPSEAVTREIREETGFETKALKLIHLYDPQKHGHPPRLFHIYHLYFQCELIGGSAATSIETQAVEFFREDEVADLDLGIVTPAQVTRIFDHHRDPNRQTAFD